MKLIYIACSYATVYLIYMKFKATYDGNHDTFRVEFLVVPVGGLSFLVNHDFSPLEILWTFSIYLESVAILPQLFMISKTGRRRPSPPTTCSSWASTAPCTSSTGSGASTSRASSTSLPWWPALSRPSCTATSSTCTSQKSSRGRSSVCQPKCQRPSPASALQVLGQDSYHSRGTRCLTRNIRNATLLLQMVTVALCEPRGKEPEGFCLMHLALSFFITMYKDFFTQRNLMLY